MSDDRRLHDRYSLWLPARIEGHESELRLAIGHDMSQSGSLLVTNVKLEVGSQVVLHVKVPPESELEHTIPSEVVRVESNSADPNGLWPYQVAIHFEEPNPELESLLRAHKTTLDDEAAASSRRKE